MAQSDGMQILIRKEACVHLEGESSSPELLKPSFGEICLLQSS